VIGRVQAERPPVCGEQGNDFLELAFERRGKIRTRLEEVLEVRRAEHQHFSRTVAAEEIVASPWTGHLDPAREVFLLLLGLLSEEIVSDAKRHLALAMQFFNDGVIFRVILKSAACINDTRER